MTLLNAPAYDEKRAKLNHFLLIGAGVLVAVFIVISFAGRLLGHGWAFTDLYAEHRVSQFFDALEAKDYDKAYGIFYNDADWKQHPAKYSGYSVQRFTEDWTKESPVKAPIVNHHIDVSATDGSGFFSTGIIVATRVNGDHKVFMYWIRKDGTLDWPAPHILQY